MPRVDHHSQGGQLRHSPGQRSTFRVAERVATSFLEGQGFMLMYALPC